MVSARRKALSSSVAALLALAGTSTVAADESLIPIRTHSLYMPYVDLNLQNRWFDFGADAIINTNQHIRLTPDRQSQTGWVWSKLPITSANWQVEFEFKVGSEGKNLFGDGFAFWATEDRGSPGPVFGNKDLFKGLGVFFDTYPNGRHAHSFPYVMVMVGDGKTSYDLANDGLKNELGGCEADFRNKDTPTKVRVKYYKDSYLEVSLAYKGWDQWDRCFTLDNVKLPAVPYIGFSALTGDVHDAHDLISVTSSSIVLPDNTAPVHSASGSTTSHTANSGSSWGFLGWVIRLSALTTVVGVAFVVFRMYSQQDAKRF